MYRFITEKTSDEIYTVIDTTSGVVGLHYTKKHKTGASPRTCKRAVRFAPWVAPTRPIPLKKNA